MEDVVERGLGRPGSVAVSGEKVVPYDVARYVHAVDSKLPSENLNGHKEFAPPILRWQCRVTSFDLVDVGLRERRLVDVDLSVCIGSVYIRRSGHEDLIA